MRTVLHPCGKSFLLLCGAIFHFIQVHIETLYWRNLCDLWLLFFHLFAVLLPSSVENVSTRTSTSADKYNLTTSSTTASTNSSTNSINLASSTSFYTASSSRPACVFRSHITTSITKTINTSRSTNHPTAIPSALSTTSHNSWLAARLLSSGQDIQLVRDVEQKLVINEGFAQERDFAECTPGIISSAYLTSIGITGLGMQRCLMRLQTELHTQCTQVSVVPYSTYGGQASSGSSNSDNSVVLLPPQGVSFKKRKVSLSDEDG